MGSLTPLAKTTIVLSWVMVLLACMSALAQLVWNRRKGRIISIVDICILAALVVGVALVAQTTWAMVDEGAGKHQSDVEQENIAAVSKSLIISEVLWSISASMIRISGCCLLLRIFGLPGKNLRWLLKGILFTCIIHGLASVLELCLICRPLATQWDPDVEGVCGNQMASFAAIEISGLLLDVLLLVIPTRQILYLRVDLKQKIGLIVAFDIGAIVLVVTCLRLKSLQLAVSSDFTYSKSYLGLLSAVGCMLSIVLCSSFAIFQILSRAKEKAKKQKRRKFR